MLFLSLGRGGGGSSSSGSKEEAGDTGDWRWWDGRQSFARGPWACVLKPVQSAFPGIVINA